MRYRGGKDMYVSVYIGAAVILVVGICATIAIIHAINRIDFAAQYELQAQVRVPSQ